MEPVIDDVDPFDLPDWLGQEEVEWRPEQHLGSRALISGRLQRAGGDEVLACDLLAVDEAYPAPVAADDLRTRAHQTWRHDQVLLVSRDQRLTLAVPGSRVSTEQALTALSRLALAVAAEPHRFAAVLRVGQERPRRGRSDG